MLSGDMLTNIVIRIVSEYISLNVLHCLEMDAENTDKNYNAKNGKKQ